jgi:dihydroorotase
MLAYCKKEKFRVTKMRVLLSGGTVYKDGRFSRLDISVFNGRVEQISPFISPEGFDKVFNLTSLFVFPGFVDVHVHLREPGFSYKETIKTGTLAAAKSGFTTICAMPNLDPPPDCLKSLQKELEIIKKDAAVRVIPYGCITKGREGKAVCGMEELAPYVAGVSDDGNGVSDLRVMEEAMRRAEKLGKIIAAHCEDKSLLGIGNTPSAESEWAMLKRDLLLAQKTGCRYHMCHVSTKESVELIRQAKKLGANITCETAPHYLLLCDEDVKDDGRYRMNPPLRRRRDMEALREGLADGTIDMIATDHAPHGREEKKRGFAHSAMGITGLECAFPVLYTGLVKTGLISLEKLIALLSTAPAKAFGLECGIKTGAPADIAVFSLSERYKIDSENFISLGKSTPFDGAQVYGKCVLTLCGGKTVWFDKNLLQTTPQGASYTD